MPDSRVTATATHVKRPSAVKTYGYNFTPELPAGVTLTGTPTVTCSPSGLTIGTPAVNTGTFLDDEGTTVAVGKGIRVAISSGTAATDYVLYFTCGGTDGGTYSLAARLEVRDT